MHPAEQEEPAEPEEPAELEGPTESQYEVEAVTTYIEQQSITTGPEGGYTMGGGIEMTQPQ